MSAESPGEAIPTSEQIEQNIISALLNEDMPREQPDPGRREPAEPPPPAPPGPSPYKPVWDELVASSVEVDQRYLDGDFGQDRTEAQALAETIRQAVKSRHIDDPFVQGYLQTPQEKRQEYLQTYHEVERVMALDARQGLAYLYQQQKNEQGERLYSDQDIEGYLQGQSRIALDREWAQARDYMNGQRARAVDIPQPTPQEIEARIEQVNARRMEMLKPLLQEEAALDNIGGIPYTDEMKDQFREMYSRLNLINPRTGEPYIYQFLEDAKNLRDTMRALVLIRDNNLSKYLSDFKEDFKGRVFEKLDPRPRPRPGTGDFTPANFPEP